MEDQTVEDQTVGTPESQQPAQPEKLKKPRKLRRQHAVIDRIEEGKWAVILVGKKEVEKIVPIEELPSDAKAGSWLKLRLIDGGVADIEVDEAATTAARGRVQSKMDALRSRSKSELKPISAAEAQTGSKLRRLTPVTEPVTDEASTSSTTPDQPAQLDQGFSQESKPSDS